MKILTPYKTRRCGFVVSKMSKTVKRSRCKSPCRAEADIGVMICERNPKATGGAHTIRLVNEHPTTQGAELIIIHVHDICLIVRRFTVLCHGVVLSLFL